MVTDVIVALKATCIKNVKFKIIKIRTGCRCGILLPQRKPKLGRTKPSTGPHAGRRSDVVGIDSHRRVDACVTAESYRMNRLLFADALAPHAWIFLTGSSARI